MDKKGVERNFINLGHPSFDKTILSNFFKDNKITFFDEMISYYENKEIIISHAPFSPKITRLYSIEKGLLEQLNFELMNNFLDPKKEDEPVVGINKWMICGHQNNYGERKKISIYSNSKKIFLDTGCGYHKENPLSCISYPNLKTIYSEVLI